MTDKQCRDKIMGLLSASMMPMEMEAECVAFLDRCLDQSWHPAEQLPVMHDERIEECGEVIEYQISDPVLAYTKNCEMVTVRVTCERNIVFWIDDDGSNYTVTHWRKLPAAPEVDEK